MLYDGYTSRAQTPARQVSPVRCLYTNGTYRSNLRVRSLVDLKVSLEKMKKRHILKHILGKDRISATLLDRERALQDSYNALLVSKTHSETRYLLIYCQDVDCSKYIHYCSGVGERHGRRMSDQ